MGYPVALTAARVRRMYAAVMLIGFILGLPGWWISALYIEMNSDLAFPRKCCRLVCLEIRTSELKIPVHCARSSLSV